MANYQDLLDLLLPERYKSLSKKDIFVLISVLKKKKKKEEEEEVDASNFKVIH